MFEKGEKIIIKSLTKKTIALNKIHLHRRDIYIEISIFVLNEKTVIITFDDWIKIVGGKNSDKI